ncbi:FAD-dependent monooxygenase [Streptomyces sp. ISL-10]|uniref:FAD-dependent oxidoreductase n=1 Tax=Streptomyces sp. ISL-10 TaxID=2819172 RepID=UPI001BE61265|nr:FAD-dependent oxidoreductase [Streptomyces sp. ISL-10]MBT2368731.1 FAD-dependent monooxygenase [Streptomyces sp. ISL-10]
MHGKPSTARAADFDTDVLIVGAGPTGLLLAGDLARAGLSVTLVERRPPGISNITRAFGVHARTLELLDARDLADELVTKGTPITGVRLFRRLSLDLGTLPSRFPFLLITPQYEVEKLLERRARSAGVDFRHGTELTAIDQSFAGRTTPAGSPAGPVDPPASVTAELRGADGTRSTLRTRYLVGADGVRSSVREALGLPFPGASVITSLVLADVRLAEEPADLLTVDGAGDTFAFIAPFGDGWYRVMGWNRTRQVPDSEPVDLDEVREIARQALGSDFGMHDARWISRFHSDERQAPAYRVGRVFLAGDAAHVHSPAGGQGMNTGLQDAANLSWKLASAVQGLAPDPEALLDSYQSERHPVGAMVVRSSGAIVRLAMAHTPLQRAARSLAASVVNSVRPAARKAMGVISGIGISYGGPRRAHPLTGRRAPDLRLAEGRLYELLRKGEFVLIGPADQAVATAAAVPAAPGRVIRAHWATGRRTALLVRPDGYIAWAAGRGRTVA